MSGKPEGNRSTRIVRISGGGLSRSSDDTWQRRSKDNKLSSGCPCDGMPFRIEMLDSLYDKNRNYKTEVRQTYIIFYKQTCKFCHRIAM